MCELDPLWPIIAVGLSGLALLATMLLIQRLLTLEVRAEVEQDLSDIDVLHDATAWTSRRRLLGDPKSIRRRYLRLLILLLPSLLLLFASSYLLYKVIADDCDWIERSSGGSPTVPSDT